MELEHCEVCGGKEWHHNGRCLACSGEEF